MMHQPATKTLLIHGDEALRGRICEILCGRGHEVLEVGDVGAGAEVLAEGRFLLVLVDLDAKPAEAVSTCHRLLGASSLSEFVLVALTSRGDAESVGRILEAGADDVFDLTDDANRLGARLAVVEKRICGGQQMAPFARCLPDACQFPVGEFRIDAEGRIVSANATLAEMLGYDSPDAIHGRHLDETATPGVFDLRALLDGTGDLLDRLDMDWHRKDGRSFPVRLHGRRVRDEQGRVTGFHGLVEEVTERRRSEAHPREMLAELQAIHESAAEAMFVVEAESAQILSANRAASEMLGYSEEELLSVRAFELHPPEIRAELHRRMSTGGAGTAIRELGVPTQRKNGTLFFTDIVGRRTVYQGRKAVIGFFRDSTEATLAARKLEESERRYRLIAENVTDLIWTIGAKGIDRAANRLAEVPAQQVAEELVAHFHFTYVSPSVERMLGYTVEEAMKVGPRILLPAESLQAVTAVLAEELEVEARHPRSTGPQRTVEIRHITKGGTLRWTEITTTFLRGEDHQITGILGVTRDITQRREAEGALRDSEATFRSLFQNLPDFVVVVDANAEIQYANSSGGKIAPEELTGSNGFGFIQPKYQPACQQAFGRALQTRQTQSVECVDVFGIRWACRIVPLSREGLVHSAMIICTDVTEEHKAKQALRREQKLLRRLLELHDRDRQLLAFELHDGFTQLLTGAVFNLETADSAVRQAAAPIRENFERGIQLLREGIEEARRLVSGLCPPVLDEFGIVAGIEHLVGINQVPDGPQITFLSKGRIDRLAPALENALFRIVQETISNARSHSQSETLEIELAGGRSEIHLRIDDEGVGFDPETVDESHFGLRGIRERARLLDGTAVIESAPGKGTRIRVQLPLVKAASEPKVSADSADGCSRREEDSPDHD